MMRLVLLLTFVITAVAALADDLADFRGNDKIVASRTYASEAKAYVDDNLEILIEAARRARTEKQVQLRIADFNAAAASNDEGFATSFSWAAGSRVRNGEWTIICVNYGPVGRVAVFRSGQRIPVTDDLSAMLQRRPEILAVANGIPLLTATYVRDAGARENSKIYSLMLDRERVGVRLIAEAEYTLDWGGPYVSAGKLVVNSIDPPKSFFVANTEALFRHRRIYRIDPSGVFLEKDEPDDLALRYLDIWMDNARSAAKLNKMQAVLLKYLPEIEMIDDYTAKEFPDGSVAVVLRAPHAEVRFALKPTGSGYRVASAQGKVR